MHSIRPWKMFIVAGILLVSVWIAATYAAQRPDRSDNTYDVIVGPQKSDMERMIEAYERLSDQYLVLVQDNLALMANQDRLILEKVTALEKKIDLLTEKLDAVQQAAPAKDIAVPEQTPAPIVKN